MGFDLINFFFSHPKQKQHIYIYIYLSKVERAWENWWWREEKGVIFEKRRKKKKKESISQTKYSNTGLPSQFLAANSHLFFLYKRFINFITLLLIKFALSFFLFYLSFKLYMKKSDVILPTKTLISPSKMD